MDIQNTYDKILQDLKNETRPLLKLKEEDFKECFLALGNSFENLKNSYNDKKSEEEIKQTLCILDHTTNHSPIFEGILCRILKADFITTEIKIYCLSATQGMIIQRRNFLGEKLPDFYLDTLELLLKSKDPELYEWTLRTIDETGSQGKSLAKTILSSRPRFLKMLNSHYRNSHDLIEMLTNKWGLSVKR